jgi:DamX protein
MMAGNHRHSKDPSLMVLPPRNRSTEPPDPAGFLHHEASGDSPLLPDAGDAEGERMETMQTSLVERIAAMEDERRRTAAQMQAALDAHGAEVAGQLRGQRRLLLGLAVLMILLATAVVGYLHLQASARYEALAERVTGLRQGIVSGGGATPAEASAAAAGEAPAAAPAEADLAMLLRARLEELAAQGSSLSDHVTRLTNEVASVKAAIPAGSGDDPASTGATAADSRPVADSTPGATAPDANAAGSASSPATADASGTVAKVTAATPSEPPPTAIEAKSASVSRPVRTPAPQATPAPAPMLAVAPEPDANAATASGAANAAQRADPEPAAAARTSGTGVAPGARAAAADGGAPIPAVADRPTSGAGEQATEAERVDALVDALISRQLTDIEHEYQRLARQVAAPAVRSRSDDDASSDSLAALIDGQRDAAGPDDASAAGGASQRATGAVGQAGEPPRTEVGGRPFVLQMIGFFNRGLLDAFIERSPLPAQVYVREETFRGRPWFVLIHSLHADRATARAAVEELPPELAKLDLWIRELPGETVLEVVPTSGEGETAGAADGGPAGGDGSGEAPQTR